MKSVIARHNYKVKSKMKNKSNLVATVQADLGPVPLMGNAW